MFLWRYDEWEMYTDETDTRPTLKEEVMLSRPESIPAADTTSQVPKNYDTYLSPACSTWSDLSFSLG